MKKTRYFGRKDAMSASASGVLLYLLAAMGGNRVWICAVAALIGAGIGLFLPRMADARKKKKEKRFYDLDMADYLTAVSLLLSAGLTLWDALRRSMNGCDLNRPLFRELQATFDRIDSGKEPDPVHALENMAARCRVPSVSTFVCTVIQNYRKGNGEVAAVLMDLARTCRTERRMIAAKLADEATTLLLIPSTLVLLAMLLILVAPAILQLIGL